MAAIQTGENYRNRQKVRVGFRPEIGVTLQGEDNYASQGRRQKTPIQRARGELAEALKAYNISDVLERGMIAEATLLDTITTMSMPTLAATLVYLHDYPEPTAEDFTDENLDVYLNRLTQDFIYPTRGKQDRNVVPPDQREIAEVRHKYKQTMFRYILKIIGSRPSLQEEEVEFTTTIPQEAGDNDY